VGRDLDRVPDGETGKVLDLDELIPHEGSVAWARVRGRGRPRLRANHAERVICSTRMLIIRGSRASPAKAGAGRPRQLGLALPVSR
jgi:hypothetical protein